MCSGWLHHEILNSPDVPGRNDAGGGTGDGSALRLVMAGRRLGLLKRHVNALRASFIFISFSGCCLLRSCALFSFLCVSLSPAGWGPWERRFSSTGSGTRRLSPQ